MGNQNNNPRQNPIGFRAPVNMNNAPSFVAHQQFSYLEDSLKSFMNKVRNTNLINTQSITRLENQVGKLANQQVEREKGKFPSQLTCNPKDAITNNVNHIQNPPFEHNQGQVNAITTLRSGHQINNQVRMLISDEEEVDEKKEEIIPEDSNTLMKDSNSNINPN